MTHILIAHYKGTGFFKAKRKSYHCRKNTKCKTRSYWD